VTQFCSHLLLHENKLIYKVDASRFCWSLVINSVMWQMTTAIAVEDVRREVKILKALSGHNNLVKFHDSFEDANNVYIVMEYVYPC
jgi:serine/threonine protein kinase